MIEHKRLAYLLIGKMYEEEHKRYIMQLDHKNLVEDLDFWMYNFNKMKSSSKIRNILKNVSFIDLE